MCGNDLPAPVNAFGLDAKHMSSAQLTNILTTSHR
jgi:hypothetical protein